MNKNILLLAYVFPPYPGIGGRRWAKFAKYLSRRGYTVHVICSENPFDEQSNWTKDVENNPNIILYPLSPKYPKILLEKPQTISEKISYRLNYFGINLMVKGSPYERALAWKTAMIDLASEIIFRYKIINIIATGAPFRILHHSLELKKKFPASNLIVDFRDQWTDNDSFFGYKELPGRKLKYEKMLEREVLQNASYVLTVSDQMTSNLKLRSGKSNATFKTLHNGFDEDDVPVLKTPIPEGRKIKMVFSGNVYNEIEHIFFPFLDMIKNMEKEFSTTLSVRFVGTCPKKYVDYVKENKISIITFSAQVPLKEALLEIQSSDYCLLFLNDDHTFSMSTKFMEYLAMRKMVIVFSNPGMLHEYVSKNKIGFSCRLDTIESDFRGILKAHADKENFFNPQFDTTQFNINRLTDELQGILLPNAEFLSLENRIKKNIIYTFDYELFLGAKSGTVDICLIQPVNKILKLLNEYNNRGIFFVDTTYLLKLKEEKKPEAVRDFKKISLQLQQMVKGGHYVYPHLHPHWLDAKYSVDLHQWQLLNLNKYSFNSLSIEERANLFQSSIDLLKEILLPVKPDYQIDGYRAGGWTIQPFTDFKPYFLKYGLKYDFTVLPGSYMKSSAQNYNFIDSPSNFIYRFQDDIVIENENGEFVEFTISRLKTRKLIRLLNRIFLKALPSKFKLNGDGASVIREDMHVESVSDYHMVSFELLTFVLLPSYLDYIKKNNYMQFISHSKMMSRHHFYNFKLFVEKTNKLYDVESDFKKIKF